MKRSTRHGFLYRNSLTLVFLLLTLATLAGNALTGWHHENEERTMHGDLPTSLSSYVGSAQFLSPLFENWESEFLQMGAFVLLTVWLRQRGSSESRPLDPEDDPPDEPVPRSEQPWPVRRGGWVARLYEHSLSAALFLLFLLTFVAHLVASWHQHVEQELTHGRTAQSFADYALGAQFWFESFQNWQSEFLAVVVLCLLSIILREKDSPQSKAVKARHSDTGT